MRFILAFLLLFSSSLAAQADPSSPANGGSPAAPSAQNPAPSGGQNTQSSSESGANSSSSSSSEAGANSSSSTSSSTQENSSQTKDMGDIKAQINAGLNSLNKSDEKLASSTQESVEQIASIISSTASFETFRFISSIAAQARLARAWGASENLRLAKMIKQLSKSLYASTADLPFFRYAQDGPNIWASINAASLKNGVNTPRLLGVGIGADYISELGMYGLSLSYNNIFDDSRQIWLDSNNYSFEGYGRAYSEGVETDFLVGLSRGNTRINRSFSATGQSELLKAGSFITNGLNLFLSSGLVLEYGDLVFKPYAGVGYSFLEHSSFKEAGDLALEFDRVKSSLFDVKMAFEVRLYGDDDSYFFITPGYEQEIHKSLSDLKLNFIGTADRIVVPNDESLRGFFVLNLGGEWTVAQRLFIHLNGGAKLGKSRLFSGNVALRYKF